MPRPKRLVRPRNILLATLLFLALFIGYQVYAALTAKPGQSTDFAAKLEELTRSSQTALEDGPDAWPILRKAIDIEDDARKGLPNGPVAVADLDYSVIYMERAQPTYNSKYSWDEAESLAREALDACEKGGLFGKLDALAAAPRAVRPAQPGKLIEILLPELGRGRQLARAAAARMRLATLAGDEQKRVRSFEELLAVGRVTGQQPFLIDHLVGIAIDALAMNQIRESLLERPADADSCRAMLAAMDRQVKLPPLAYTFDAERLSCLDTIQWTHTDDGRGSGRLIMATVPTLTGGSGPGGPFGTGILSSFSQYRVMNILSIGFPSKAANVKKTNEFYDQLVAYSKLGAKERRASRFNPEAYITALPQRYIILRIMVPAVSKAIQSRDQHDMEIAGTRLMLAVETYRAEHGTPPEKLDDLIPSILPALPTDPLTGKGFGYKVLTPGEDPDGRPYLLYSLGADGVDNGGKPAAQGQEHNALRPGIGGGTDYILNRKRHDTLGDGK